MSLRIKSIACDICCNKSGFSNRRLLADTILLDTELSCDGASLSNSFGCPDYFGLREISHREKNMFIYVAYKDGPELSHIRRRSSEPDLSIEKTLLVNPNCPIRIMLEYIRKKCKLGSFTQFDLCDEGGGLMGLFNLPTYAYATDQFEHKKTYYIIVVRTESDKRLSVLPQLNYENKIYLELKSRVKKFLATGDVSPQATPPGKTTPPPPGPVKSVMKRK